MDNTILEKNKLIVKRTKRGDKKKVHKKGEYIYEEIRMTDKQEEKIEYIADAITKTVGNILQYGKRLDKVRRELQKNAI